MAKRNQLPSALGSANSGDPRDFQRISFGVLNATNTRDRCLLHTNERMSLCRTRSRGLLRDVDHAHSACFIVMREFCHTSGRFPLSQRLTPWGNPELTV